MEKADMTKSIKNIAPWWQRFAAGLNEFYHAPYRQTMARAARDEEDFFMLLMFAESLGIDNPASFYTLELQPLFLENFHEWHTRMGMDRCPFDHVGCC
ncbi:cory-CC-star protein [Psychrobacter sp. Ps4]|uniref:cory-CC-star protein n=1 Tax=unclassified Psychrobacter TaxID=196806 RepID=UPI0006D89F7E|nr:cory-CC-star protein [Psychrobacter sp. Ps4]MCG3808111.1 DNA helicase [Psychrobacter sp. Ps4]